MNETVSVKRRRSHSSEIEENGVVESSPEEYEVEKVLFHFEEGEGVYRYVVKWKNFKDEDNTSETLDNLVNCNKVLMQYFLGKEKQKPGPLEIATLQSQLTEGDDYPHKYDRLIVRIVPSNEELLVDIQDALGDFFKEFMSLPLKKLDQQSKSLSSDIHCVLVCILLMSPHDPLLITRAKKLILKEKIYDIRKNQLHSINTTFLSISQLDKTVSAIENNVDFDTVPEFKYIVKYVAHEDIVYPEEAVIGCRCEPCGRQSKNCCNANSLSKSKFPYNSQKRLTVFQNTSIYECNSTCLCNNDCINRVVQLDSQCEFEIFKTEKCGWGLRTKHKIKKGTYICKYLGEIVTELEANIRDTKYVPEKLSYIFALDYNNDRTIDDGNESTINNYLYAVDATPTGNVSRFLNHSCDPNLIVVPVFIECLDPDLPELAFFAVRDIDKGEELTFDYCCGKDRKRSMIINNTDCFCGATNCRQVVFS